MHFPCLEFFMLGWGAKGFVVVLHFLPISFSVRCDDEPLKIRQNCIPVSAKSQFGNRENGGGRGFGLVHPFNFCSFAFLENPVINLSDSIRARKATVGKSRTSKPGNRHPPTFRNPPFLTRGRE